MPAAPHANLTITLLRRNQFGPLRLRGAGSAIGLHGSILLLAARRCRFAPRTNCRRPVTHAHRDEVCWTTLPPATRGVPAPTTASPPDSSRPQHTSPQQPIYGLPVHPTKGALLDVLA